MDDLLPTLLFTSIELFGVDLQSLHWILYCNRSKSWSWSPRVTSALTRKCCMKRCLKRSQEIPRKKAQLYLSDFKLLLCLNKLPLSSTHWRSSPSWTLFPYSQKHVAVYEDIIRCTWQSWKQNSFYMCDSNNQTLTWFRRVAIVNGNDNVCASANFPKITFCLKQQQQQQQNFCFCMWKKLLLLE